MSIQGANENVASRRIDIVFLAIVLSAYVSFAFVIGFDLSTVIANRAVSYIVSFAVLGILFYFALFLTFSKEIARLQSSLLRELTARNLIEVRPEVDDRIDR